MDHTCTPPVAHTTLERKADHCFSANQLAPVVQEDVRLLGSNCKWQAVQHKLGFYLRTLPKEHFCRKVIKRAGELNEQAKQTAGPGRAPYKIGSLENYLKAMDALSYKTRLLTRTGIESKALLLAVAKRKFTKDHEDERHPPAFSVGLVPGLQERYDSINDTGRYFYGFVIVFP